MTMTEPPPSRPADAGNPADHIAALEAMLAQALRFLGHDVREGHSSTLALLELQRVKAEPMTLAQLSARIEGNARRALAAIDAFTELARARTRPLRLEEVNLADLLIEAVADVWEGANRRGVRLKVRAHHDDVPGRADRELVGRALACLLQAAAEHALRGSEIGCTVRADVQGWLVEIDGPASAAAQSDDASLGTPSRLLARAAAERHGGGLQVEITDSGEVVERVRFSSHFFPLPGAIA